MDRKTEDVKFEIQLMDRRRDEVNNILSKILEKPAENKIVIKADGASNELLKDISDTFKNLIEQLPLFKSPVVNVELNQDKVIESATKQAADILKLVNSVNTFISGFTKQDLINNSLLSDLINCILSLGKQIESMVNNNTLLIEKFNELNNQLVIMNSPKKYKVEFTRNRDGYFESPLIITS